VYEERLFDFLQTMQDHNLAQRAARDQASDDDVLLKKSTVLIPDNIIVRFNENQAAVFKLYKQCPDWQPNEPNEPNEPNDTAFADPRSLSVGTILQAYRWKAMLIQITLLSALNGICFELTELRTLPHHIHKYKVTGPEHNITYPRKLILQNFVFSNQDTEPDWFNPTVPLGLPWTSHRRTDMRHLFRQRSLTSAPPLAVPDLNFDTDLTKFVFGLEQVVANKRLKYMWRFPAIDAQRFTTANEGALHIQATDDEYSTRIESSEAKIELLVHILDVRQQARALNFAWYEHLLSA